MNNITQSIKVILLATVLSFGISYVFAWAPPTVAPTGGNSLAPLNTGSTNQAKDGTLVLTRVDGVQGIETYGTALFATVTGLVGIGTVSPWAKLTIENTNNPVTNPDLAVGNPDYMSSRIAFTNGLTSSEAIISTEGSSPFGGDTDFRIQTRSDGGFDPAHIGDLRDRFMVDVGGQVGINTTVPSEALTVGGVIETIAGPGGASGIKFADGTTQTTASSGGKIIVSSITGAFTGPYLYTALPNTYPVSLTVTISAYGGGSREGSADVRWLNDAGIVVRDWKKISGTNIGNGNDGGSGMRDMELATIPFLDGATKIEFRGVGNGYNGELISYMYQN